MQQSQTGGGYGSLWQEGESLSSCCAPYIMQNRKSTKRKVIDALAKYFVRLTDDQA